MKSKQTFLESQLCFGRIKLADGIITLLKDMLRTVRYDIYIYNYILTKTSTQI